MLTLLFAASLQLLSKLLKVIGFFKTRKRLQVQVAKVYKEKMIYHLY